MQTAYKSIVSGAMAAEAATKGLTVDLAAQAMAMAGLGDEAIVEALRVNGFGEAEAKVAAQTAIANLTLKKQSALTSKLGTAFKGLGALIKAHPALSAVTALAAATAAIAQIKRKIDEAKEEARQTIISRGEESATELKNVTELYDAYQKASDGYKAGTVSKDSFTSSTNDLLAALGEEGRLIADSGEEYANLATQIDKAVAAKKKAALYDMYAAAEAKRKSVEAKFGTNTSKTKTSQWGVPFDIEDAVERRIATIIETVVENAVQSDLGFGVGGFKFQPASPEQRYKDLLAAQKAIADYGLFSGAELAGSRIYQYILAQIAELKPEIEALNELVGEVNQNAAEIQFSDSFANRQLPKTLEQFKEFREEFVDAALKSGDYQGDEGTIVASVDEFLSELEGMDEFYGLKRFRKELTGLTGETRQAVKEGKKYKELTAEQQKEFTDLGYTMEQVDEYISMLTAASSSSVSTEESVKNLTSLSDELNGATAALEAYKNATSSEHGDIASEYAKAYQKFLEDWNAGKTGTKAVRAAVELFLPDDVLKALHYDMQAAGELLASDLYQAVFNSEEGDIGVKFANYLRENFSDLDLSGIVEITERGDSFDFAISSYQALADAIGMDVNVVHALCDALDAYGVQIFQSKEDTDELAKTLGLLGSGTTSQTERIQMAIDGLAASGKDAMSVMQALQTLASAGYIDLSQFVGGEDALANAIDNAVNHVKSELAEDEEAPEINVNVGATDHVTSEVERIIDEGQEIAGKGIHVPVTVGDGTGAEGAIDGLREDDLHLQISAQFEGDDAIAQAEAAAERTHELHEQFSADTLTIVGEDNATSVVDSAYEHFTSMDGKSITWTIHTVEEGGGSGTGHRTGGFASGTKDAPGGPAVVNERGPELISDNGIAYIAGGGKPTVVDLSPHAVVLNAQETKRALKGAPERLFGGVPIKAFASGTSSTASLLRKTPISTAKKSYEDVLNVVYCARCGTPNPTGRVTCVACSANIRTGQMPTAAAIQKSSTSSSGKGTGGGGGGGGGGSASGGSNTNWFEKQLAEHKHLVEMDKESQKEYLDWLDDAYKRAYKEGIIDLKTYRAKEEEVYKGRQEDFKDHISDTEHLIELEKSGDNDPAVIFNLYQQMMADIKNELEKCYEQGLDSTNSYVQYLQNAWIQYADDIKDIQDDSADDAKGVVKDLVDYRIKMLKQYLKDEIDSYKKRSEYLKEFYDKQKEMLQDVYDEEEYLEQQAEKRKSVADIQAELQQLEFDDSAWAQKRRNKLLEELAESEKELSKFEKQHALEVTQSELDKAYEAQVKELEAKIEELEEKLDNPKYLYDTALADVQNNSVALYEEMISYNEKYGDGIRETVVEMWEEAYKSLKRYHDLYSEYYNGINLVNATGYVEQPGDSAVIIPKKGYASGTAHATAGLHPFDENGEEYIFQSKDGTRYRMFSGGEKVLNASATNFLYKFAVSGGKILSELISGVPQTGGLAQLDRASGVTEIRMGDIIVQGNASEKTVSEIRRAQRDSVEFMLKELTRLNR